MRATERGKKYLLIIYTRLLERFISKCVSSLSKDNSTKENFLTLIERISKPFEDLQKVPLDSEYYNGVEKLVEYIRNIPLKEFDFEEEQRYILRTANGLQKIKRKRNNKKDKHKKRDFDNF